MPDGKKIVNEIQAYVDDFATNVEPIQKKLYDRVSGLLSQLSLDAEGNIKRTQANTNLIYDVKAELNSVVNNKAYQKNVAGINSALQDVTDLQENYFNKIDEDAVKPPVIDAVADHAFEQATVNLIGAGLKSAVVDAAADIVSSGITEGASFGDMNEQLRTFMLGNDKVDGKLVSYSKQIVTDTMHTQSRNYNSIMTEKLGLKWFRYVGALVADSRPWCIALEHKEWIHESELSKICSGNIDGQQVSRQGLMPDTNKENVISRCGGYNCGHHMTPVPSELVPKNIRAKFEDDLPKTKEDIIDERPTRKNK
jgi:hypothetical protein